MNVEFTLKMKKIQELLAEYQLDALLLQKVSSFAWATCGAASYVNTATTNGSASLLITPEARYLITNNIEAPRLEIEESLLRQGWEFRTTLWYETGNLVNKLTQGLRLGSDGAYDCTKDLSLEMARLRATLTPDESQRFRSLGGLCSKALEAAARAVTPGMTEHNIAGLVAAEAENRGVQAIVNLVAVDQRISFFRHPLPTLKKMDRYAMLVLCGRRAGLVCSVTRLVHFGPLPSELRRKVDAVANVDASLIAGTRPGRTMGDVLQGAINTYAAVGFPEEWMLHHQGGTAGYEPREILAVPGSQETVLAGQVYAWNPSITGAKSEDTILVGTTGNEIVTAMHNWPTIAVEINGQTILRPDVLVID